VLLVGWAFVLGGWPLPGAAAAVVITLGFVLVMVGLVRVGPRLVQRLAPPLGRAGRSAGTLLAARRLEADPRGGFRSGAAMTLTLFAAVVAIVMTSSLDLREARKDERDARERGVPASGGPDFFVRGSSTLLGPEGTDPSIVDALRDVRGVEEAVPIYASVYGDAIRDPANPEVNLRFRQRVVVAECRDFLRAVRTQGVDCPSGVLVPGSAPPGVPMTFTFRATDGTEFPVTLPVSGRLPLLDDDSLLETQGVTHWTTQLSGATALIPPALVPADARARGEVTDVLVRTDGTVAAARRVGALLATRFPGLDATSEIRRAQVDLDDYRESIRPLLYGGLLFVLVIAACSLTVTTIDSIFERRRPLATVRAVGASPATLRAAAALEAAAPLLVAGALGAMNGLLAGVVLVAVIDAPLVMPWADLAALFALVCAAMVTTVAAVTGTIGRATAADALRTA
jgi:hypothetical protein